MADEELASVPNEPANEPIIAAEQATTEKELPADIEAPETEAEEAAGDEPVAEIEFVTVERNGKTYQVPKELEGELLMHSDYTKKTQGVSERAKELDSREAGLAQQLEATEGELRDRALILQAKAELDQYENVDWDKLWQEDPVGAGRHQSRYQSLQREFEKTNAALTTKQTERTQAAERDFATRVEQTAKFAQDKIPGWKPELMEPLVKLALDAGVPDTELKRVWSPAVLKLLHQAHVGALAMNKQATTKLTPVPVVPLQTVAGKSTPAASKTLNDVANGDDMEAYAAMRKAGRVR